MKRLGIDVKRTFEQMANTSIELDHDDLPPEPEIGEQVLGETGAEVERMCGDVRGLLRAPEHKNFCE